MFDFTHSFCTAPLERKNLSKIAIRCGRLSDRVAKNRVEIPLTKVLIFKQISLFCLQTSVTTSSPTHTKDPKHRIIIQNANTCDMKCWARALITLFSRNDSPKHALVIFGGQIRMHIVNLEDMVNISYLYRLCVHSYSFRCISDSCRAILHSVLFCCHYTSSKVAIEIFINNYLGA